MDRKIIVMVVIAIILAFAIIYGISAISSSGGQITGQAVRSAAPSPLPEMVGGC